MRVTVLQLITILSLGVGLVASVEASSSSPGDGAGVASITPTNHTINGATPNNIGGSGPFGPAGAISVDQQTGYIAAITSGLNQVEFDTTQATDSWQSAGSTYRANATAINESYIYLITTSGQACEQPITLSSGFNCINMASSGAGSGYSLVMDDSTGTLYAATSTGVYTCESNCFSGASWSQLASPPFSNNFFTTSLIAKNGTLYLWGYVLPNPPTYGSPVYAYNNGIYTKVFNAYNGVQATSVAADESGNVYVGTSGYGSLNGAGFVLKCPKSGSSYSTCTALTESSLDNSGITALGVNESGDTIYAGAYSGNVYTYASSTWSSAGTLDGIVNYMMTDELGNAYAGTSAGSVWVNLIAGSGWTNISPTQ